MVRETVGPNGQRVLDMLDAMKQKRRDIKYEPTDGGFHVSVETKKGLVKVIQVWGEMKNTDSQRIETRQQWYSDSLGLSEEDKKWIFLKLRRNLFSETTGEKYNAKLNFDEDCAIFTPDDLSRIQKALEEVIDQLKERGNNGTPGSYS